MQATRSAHRLAVSHLQREALEVCYCSRRCQQVARQGVEVAVPDGLRQVHGRAGWRRCRSRCTCGVFAHVVQEHPLHRKQPGTPTQDDTHVFGPRTRPRHVHMNTSDTTSAKAMCARCGMAMQLCSVKCTCTTWSRCGMCSQRHANLGRGRASAQACQDTGAGQPFTLQAACACSANWCKQCALCAALHCLLLCKPQDVPCNSHEYQVIKDAGGRDVTRVCIRRGEARVRSKEMAWEGKTSLQANAHFGWTALHCPGPAFVLGERLTLVVCSSCCPLSQCLSWLALTWSKPRCT